mmetsp:Transcript_115053/g.200224  ORF Transcript_115053/g.200224 Transcript_115053/m.200224 type:complete len:103 (+) Transcript_115053:1998-2306(+)
MRSVDHPLQPMLTPMQFVTTRHSLHALEAYKYLGTWSNTTFSALLPLCLLKLRGLILLAILNELRTDEVHIQPTLCQQLLVSSLLNDLPLIQDKDAICIYDG